MAMEESVKSSGTLAVGTTTVTTQGQGPARVHYVSLKPAAAASSVIVYDGTAATGTVLVDLVAPANGLSAVAELSAPVLCTTGIITAVVAGTAASAIVHYSLQ